MNAGIIPDRLELVVLAWLWCQGKPAKQQGAVTGLKAFLSGANSAAQDIGEALARLAGSGAVERIEPAKKTGKPEFRTTPAGVARAGQWLGREQLPARPWPTVSGGILPAIALGLPIPADAKAIKDSAKRLPLAVCVRHLHLPIPLDRGLDVARLELLKLAISTVHKLPPEKIHLKITKIPTGELPALFVGPLLGVYGLAGTTVDKLLEIVALQTLGVSKAAQIKSSSVRRWLCEPSAQPALPVQAIPTAQPAITTPVDLSQFAKQVIHAAKSVAKNYPSAANNLGDQVLIHYCWEEYQRLYTKVALEQFTRLLRDCNSVRQLVLVGEDLIPQERAAEFRDSEVRVGATSYHYVRITS